MWCVWSARAPRERGSDRGVRRVQANSRATFGLHGRRDEPVQLGSYEHGPRAFMPVSEKVSAELRMPDTIRDRQRFGSAEVTRADSHHLMKHVK